MEFSDVKNPVCQAADGSVIHCQVKFDAFADYVPFAASARDTEPHGQAIYNALIAGTYGFIAPFAPPEIPPAPQGREESANQET